MADKTSKKKKGFFRRLAAKKLELFVYFLAVAITIVVAWPFFTTIIEAGHAGVYYSRFWGGTVTDKTYGEGIQFMLPWDSIIPYDCRMQSKDYNITALTKGGLEVKVDMSVIWYVEKDQVGYLHITAGPDYREKIIDPSVMSTVRSIIGSYEQSGLYDGSPLKLQEEVMGLLNETLTNAPFTVHSILIREVKLPEEMAGAISEKFVAEQNVLAERYRVLEAIEHYKKSFVEAEGVRITQSIVNDGMSEAYLRYLGIQATLELAESENAKLVIIGDKDGLPLILNPDTLEVSTTLPEGISENEYIPEGEEGARMKDLTDTYDRMQGYLDQMDDVLGDLMDTFPQAGESIGDSSTLPQENTVPTVQGRED